MSITDDRRREIVRILEDRHGIRLDPNDPVIVAYSLQMEVVEELADQVNTLSNEIDEIFEKIKNENQARLDTLDKSHNEIIDRASNKAMESIINESKQTRQMANDCIIEGLNETLKLINAEMESGIKNLKDEFNRSKRLSEIIIRLGIFIAGIILATCNIKVITSLSGAG